MGKRGALTAGRADVHGLKPVTGCQPFILEGYPAPTNVAAPHPRVFLLKAQTCDRKAMDQGNQPQGLSKSRWHIADADLDSSKIRPRANVPEDVFERRDGPAIRHDLVIAAEFLPIAEV